MQDFLILLSQVSDGPHPILSILPSPSVSKGDG